ncbi:uncharacterized protein BBOV_IV003550 [Babesia bovis T2Bo]|uniref:Uncharacterized protein n=1 Tax=Babesia bovis TaxID=5865 RepID=A7AVX5_BABBO|nr:uncharacterized protein BBOV_IV003550 [Babesia bovis T2Bo]EDO05951.1 hypothetical protein BBOV_IV003550 [Babesia bovis T2Bo]|eukprot:XP_001609519.1 hypothetical protein [Babesia bovis T2Bo]
MLKWQYMLTQLHILVGLAYFVTRSTFGSVVPEKPGNSIITEDLDRFTLYKVRLSNVSGAVNAEDFRVELIGTQFVHITAEGSTVDWKIRLDTHIPIGVIFYPEFSLAMERLERDVAV